MSQHNLSGTAHPAMGSGNGATTASPYGQNVVAAGLANSVLSIGNGTHAAQWGKAKISTNKTIFSARIEVVQVNNGYIVQIGRQEGYEYDSYIAENIKQVNDILAAQIVTMKLEGQ